MISETVMTDVLKTKFSPALIEKHFGSGKKGIRLYHGKGCPVCGDTGYSGRVGVFEVMAMSESVRELVMKRANADQIRDQAIKEGMKTMIEDGIRKALAGLTTIEEVLRATRE